MDSPRIENSEYFKEPHDHDDHNDNIKYLLDLRIHRDKPVDEIQTYADGDENEYELN